MRASADCPGGRGKRVGGGEVERGQTFEAKPCSRSGDDCWLGLGRDEEVLVVVVEEEMRLRNMCEGSDTSMIRKMERRADGDRLGCDGRDD